jgi:uroporphyrinogen decarboxylase
MTDIFANRKQTDAKTNVPVWFMRQAGRYHDHYQNLKKEHTFMELCKQPELALETTLGPIREFDFDAAILFSDLLFPLEQMGLGLEYTPGPKLSKHMETLEDVKNATDIAPASEFYKFQKDACVLLKENLPSDKTLLGFVGAPFTLFSYAAQGSHQGSLVGAKKGLYDGRFNAFYDKLLPNVLTEMSLQAQGGADAVCIFDTAVGELGFKDYKNEILPKLREITSEFKKMHPDTKIVYYSRNTHMRYLEEIQDKNIDVLGVDWRHDLSEVLNTFSKDYYIQGNFDPCWLHIEWNQLENNLKDWYEYLLSKNIDQSKWICGLGHGVLQHTPQMNVKNAVAFIHDNFRY